MNTSIASAIALIGIGLTTNVFANASGTQVNPSTINLSAIGVTDVGIHTQLGAGECNVPDNSIIMVEVLNGGLVNGSMYLNM